MQAVAVNKTSEDEFNAVSVESCNTPITKPTATTCIAKALSMPKRLQANGINIKEPPGTPDVPQAQTDATTHKSNAVKKSTSTPKLKAAAKDKTVIVMAAPAILMVAPSGIVIEYVLSSKSKRRQSARFTGMFAADDRVKNAVTPLSRKQAKVNGYGFRRV